MYVTPQYPDTLTPMRAKCQGPQCRRESHAKGLCDTHYRQMKKGNGTTAIGVAKTKKRGKIRSKYNKKSELTGKITRARCSFPKCVKGAYCREVCRGHYSQLERNKALTPLQNKKPNLFMAPLVPLRSKRPDGYDSPSLSLTFPDFPDEPSQEA